MCADKLQGPSKKSAARATQLRELLERYNYRYHALDDPEVPDAEKRKPRFLVLLTDAEHALVEAAGKPKVSTWARETLVRAAKRQSKHD